MLGVDKFGLGRFFSFSIYLVSLLLLPFHKASASDTSLQLDQSTVKTFAAYSWYSAVVKSDGSLWRWGGYDFAQMKNDTAEDVIKSAVRVDNANNWASVAIGGGFFLAIKTDGTLWAWGDNSHGELGLGADADKPIKYPDKVINITPAPRQVGKDADWAAVSASNVNSAALKKNGTLWTWGNNNDGQLGYDGYEADTPQQVGFDTDWTMVSLGDNFTVALKTDGSLWTWGSNQEGQLGNGDTSRHDVNYPSQVGTDKDWLSVATCSSHVIALKKDGSLWAWGDNYYGQLGDGTVWNRYAPVQIGSATDWTAIAAGSSHSMAIKKDGTLWTWGWNRYGQLGFKTQEEGGDDSLKKPYMVGKDTDWAAAAGGYIHTVAMKKDGTLWAWGGDFLGQLGDGDTEQKSTPQQIDITPPAGGITINGGVASAASQHITLSLPAVDDKAVSSMQFSYDGKTWTPPETYSANRQWILPSNDGVKTVYVKFIDSSGIISPVYSASVVLDAPPVTTATPDGGMFGGPINVKLTSSEAATIYYTTDGSAPTTSSTVYSVPIKINSTTTLKYFGVDSSGNQEAIKTGAYSVVKDGWLGVTFGLFMTAIRADGTLWAWVFDEYFDPDTFKTDTANPRQMGKGNNWAVFSTFDRYSAGVRKDGTLWTMGCNQGGFNVGENKTVIIYAPNCSKKTGNTTLRQFGTDSNWSTVSASDLHLIALKKDGTLWAAGMNDYGQVGDGTYTYRPSLIRIGKDRDWSAVAAGLSHSMALKKDGSLWGWGAGNIIGAGYGVTNATPMRIGLDTDWSYVAAGENYTIALKKDGSLWAWGFNTEGEFGDGTNIPRYAPVQVGTDFDWMKVSAGRRSVLALKTDGSLWAWGDNGNGQLGDGTTTNRNSPVRIGGDTDWAVIASGDGNSAALKKNGTLWTWGANVYGQLGDGTHHNSTVPLQIRPFLLSISTPGTGYGTISDSAGNIILDSQQKEIFKGYDSNAKVTLTASPGEYAYFAGWAGDCKGRKTVCTLTMDSNRKVTAFFNPDPVLTVNKGEGSGSIMRDPLGIGCGSDCDENWDYFGLNTKVKLTAQPADGYVFNMWQGAKGCKKKPVCTVTMNKDQTVTAYFLKLAAGAPPHKTQSDKKASGK